MDNRELRIVSGICDSASDTIASAQVAGNESVTVSRYRCVKASENFRRKNWNFVLVVSVWKLLTERSC